MKRGASLFFVFSVIMLMLASPFAYSQVAIEAVPQAVPQSVLESEPAENVKEKEFLEKQFTSARKFETHYAVGPSYEGFSREQEIYARAFQFLAEDVGPDEVKSFCSEPEIIADRVIEKLKAKLGDVSNACNDIGKSEAQCIEESKKNCGQIGKPFIHPAATELEKKEALANACPPNEQALIEACKERSMEYMRARLEFADEVCDNRWQTESQYLKQQCEQKGTFANCQRESFVKECLNRYGAQTQEVSQKEYVCPSFPPPGYVKPACDQGNLEPQHDSFGCQIGYKCVAPITVQPVQQPCTSDYKPVCGANDLTYQNECWAKYANVQVQYAGECKARCPLLGVPVCAEGQSLKASYDANGCITTYQCVAQQTACPVLEVPGCAEGTTLSKTIDEKGCVTGYQCVASTATTTTETTETTTTATSTTAEQTSTSTATKTDTTTTNQITSGAVTTTYDKYVEECNRNWEQQERYCNEVSRNCDKANFISQCKQDEKRNFENNERQSATQCKIDVKVQFRHLQSNCARMEADKQRCLEDTAQQCSKYTVSADECRKTLTEENLRNFIISEAKKRCKFIELGFYEKQAPNAPRAEVIIVVLNTASELDLEKLRSIVENSQQVLTFEDTTVYKGEIKPSDFGQLKLAPYVANAKLSAVQAAEVSEEVKKAILTHEEPQLVAAKLASLRENGLPPEFLYVIDDKANDLVDVSDDLEGIEESEAAKGLGYKFGRWLGFAKAAEENEIAQLEGSLGKLDSSIQALEGLIETVPDNIAKAVLKEQVESLKEQRAELEKLIKDKHSRANGLIRLFGLFG